MEGHQGYERVRDSDWDEKAIEERKKLTQALTNELGMQNKITHFDQISHEDMATSYSGRLFALQMYCQAVAANPGFVGIPWKLLIPASVQIGMDYLFNPDILLNSTNLTIYIIV